MLSPIVFVTNIGGNNPGTFPYYGEGQYTYGILNILNYEQELLLLNATNTKLRQLLNNTGGTHFPTGNVHIFIPPKRIVIFFKSCSHKHISSFSNPIEIYTSGIHCTINRGDCVWLGKEEEKDELFTTLKNIGYNCNNIIEY